MFALLLYGTSLCRKMAKCIKPGLNLSCVPFLSNYDFMGIGTQLEIMERFQATSIFLIISGKPRIAFMATQGQTYSKKFLSHPSKTVLFACVLACLDKSPHPERLVRTGYLRPNQLQSPSPYIVVSSKRKIQPIHFYQNYKYIICDHNRITLDDVFSPVFQYRIIKISNRPTCMVMA